MECGRDHRAVAVGVEAVVADEDRNGCQWLRSSALLLLDANAGRLPYKVAVGHHDERVSLPPFSLFGVDVDKR